MATFKRILFPVDLSSVSTAVVDHVLTMAKQFSAELHVLYVVRTFEAFTEIDFVPAVAYQTSQAAIHEAAKKSLHEFVTANLADCPNVQVALTTGHTAREILAYIQAHNISLVVMGTHGRRGLDKILFGSVAQRVVQSSPVPVLTVRPSFT